MPFTPLQIKTYRDNIRRRHDLARRANSRLTLKHPYSSNREVKELNFNEPTNIDDDHYSALLKDIKDRLMGINWGNFSVERCEYMHRLAIFQLALAQQGLLQRAYSDAVKIHADRLIHIDLGSFYVVAEHYLSNTTISEKIRRLVITRIHNLINNNKHKDPFVKKYDPTESYLLDTLQNDAANKLTSLLQVIPSNHDWNDEDTTTLLELSSRSDILEETDLLKTMVDREDLSIDQRYQLIAGFLVRIYTLATVNLAKFEETLVALTAAPVENQLLLSFIRGFIQHNKLPFPEFCSQGYFEWLEGIPVQLSQENKKAISTALNLHSDNSQVVNADGETSSQVISRKLGALPIVAGTLVSNCSILNPKSVATDAVVVGVKISNNKI